MAKKILDDAALKLKNKLAHINHVSSDYASLVSDIKSGKMINIRKRLDSIIDYARQHGVEFNVNFDDLVAMTPKPVVMPFIPANFTEIEDVSGNTWRFVNGVWDKVPYDSSWSSSSDCC